MVNLLYKVNQLIFMLMKILQKVEKLYYKVGLEVLMVQMMKMKIMRMMILEIIVIISEKDAFNNTPLHWALWSNEGNPQTIHLLLERGAELLCINKFGENPLHLARNVDRVKEVIEWTHHDDSLSTKTDF